MQTSRTIQLVITVAHSFAEADAADRAYWLSRPAWERWQAIELTRQFHHGEHYSAQRLQRVLEVAQRTRG